MYNIFFTKMHGLGNDFVIIDKNTLPYNFDLNNLAQKITNRKTGIGADQMILYYEIDTNCYGMEIYNLDGSKASACGNASRCVIQIVHGITKSKNIEIIVEKRKIQGWIEENSGLVSVNMGVAKIKPAWEPIQYELLQMASKYNVPEPICVDVGNKHLILFLEDFDIEHFKILGPKISDEKIFEDGINVNFAQVKNKQIKLVVCERGVGGLTLSCGSGACATFAAANKLGFVDDSAEIEFSMGKMVLTKIKDNIIMTGPVSLVGVGTYYLS